MRRAVSWSRRALRELKDQDEFIAEDNQPASARVAAAMRKAGTDLGKFSTGRPARVPGYFEKSVTGLPYILAYAIRSVADGETIVILRVIHTSQDWPVGGWPRD